MQLTNFENMPHQTATLEATWDKEAWAWFLETGLGKTKLALDNGLMLFQKGLITGMLVMAPKGAYLTWNEIEIPKLMPNNGVSWESAQWSAGMGFEAQQKVAGVIVKDERLLKILVINIEGVLTHYGYQTVVSFLNAHRALWVIDESTAIKNPKAKRTKEILDIKHRAAFRRIMTGFPINKEPVDLYSQLEFLQDAPLGFSSWYAFRGCFQKMKPTAIGRRIVMLNIGSQNEEVLNHRLKEISTRYRKEDCLKDLPPKTYSQRVVELTTEQRKHYDNIRHNAYTFLSEQDMVTTTMVITQIIRLQQIICGFAVPDDPDADTVRLDSNRIDALMDILSEHDGKVVIWSHFRECVKMIEEAIREEYGRQTVASYFGDTADKARAEILRNFQSPRHDLRYFVGNPATGKFSLTLTEARLCVYFSNSYDLEARRQSEDRLHRKGQLNPVTYVDLQTPRTVDQRIVRNLVAKQRISDTIMGDRWKEWFQD